MTPATPLVRAEVRRASEAGAGTPANQRWPGAAGVYYRQRHARALAGRRAPHEEGDARWVIRERHRERAGLAGLAGHVDQRVGARPEVERRQAVRAVRAVD